MRQLKTSITAALTAASLLPASLEAAHLWVEGESGTAENVSPNGWYLSVRKGDLSGGDWLASYGGRDPVLAHYKAQVAEAGNYTLWVRANPISATMDVQVGDAGGWKPVPISEDNIDALNIADDGKPDMRFLAWTKVGAFDLAAGNTSLKFRMTSKNGRHGAIDCFCLTTDSEWKPNKAIKPGESTDWPAPVLSSKNLREWSDFIRPSKDDLGWRDVRWHKHLDEAAAEAKKLGRPVLLWAMNGHPCGET